MADESKRQDQLLETTDCLEAIGTLKNAKNLFFFISFICLLILQAIFWLTPTKYIELPNETAQSNLASVSSMIAKLAVPAKQEAKIETKTQKIEQAAQALTADANAAKTDPNTAAHTKHYPQIKIKFANIAWTIRVCNYLLAVSTIIYSLTLLFAMKISLVGRLGGISHITKAVFVSFLVVVLILPWQLMFKSVLFGVIYTPAELLAVWENFSGYSAGALGLMVMRFSLLWLVVTLLLINAQLRSMRWSKNTLKRLGIIG
ncbi:MAG: hypothetical protein CVV39_00505 [Planctomycetes bacterium HGW-Planctomycetes-1]|nr:MAG: hypothetical protein CVV39_00505 [Planctomycetes bacterium HGW-Planctomycetes-1]